MSTSLKLYATNNGKAVNTTFSSVNPNATAAQMKSAAQALNNLTQNTYSKSEKIETTDLDSSAAKSVPSITLAEGAPALNRTNALAGYTASIDMVTDGELAIVTGDSGGGDNSSWVTCIRKGSSGAWRLFVGLIKPDETQSFATVPHNIIIRSAETDTYQAGEFILTIEEG